MPQPSPGGAAAADAPQPQSHPLHALDRVVVDRLLAAAEPTDADLVDAARLLMRYEGFPGAQDIQDDLAKVLRFWTLSRAALHERTRAIWAADFRPSPSGGEAVGSGFDTSAQES
ncbi:DUF3288 family protein [Cyanobium sp. NS01]|uniref:DUF3288 family protein n=1 Tax=Cyanobium sp. NS01 TaxID=261284 RepID=UPI001644EE3A|nr:DUF3288 family protein [Cyanobium sp. NS01]